MWCHVSAVSAGPDIIVRVSPRAATETDSGLALRLAATASLGAAVIHFAVVPTHWNQWVPSGLFFIAIALFQLIWARVLLTRTTTAVLAAGTLGNAGAAALWALSRIAGAPFGPHAGLPELVQAADLCALLLEMYVVMGAGWVWYRGRRAAPIPAFANAIVLLGLGAVITSAAAVGVASGLRDDHHGPAAAESHHPPDAPAPVEAPQQAATHHHG
ncbi:hypothetical protein [Mycobacterium sp. URHB0044]|jgi:hypothetical protein|uniref:hypothetical protein n=1 Tax=Mycobacterium sp. URHB0044 TaxID=1380386 RepID=UPI00350FF8E3